MQTIKENISWHDILSPSEEDIKFLKERFNVHPVILEELKTPSARQKVEIYGELLYLVLHFPFFDPEKRTSRPLEIDILAKADEVATVRYEEFEPIDDFMKKCEALPGLKSQCLGATSAEFIYRLVQNVFDYIHRELHHISEKIVKVEDAVFSGKEKEMIKEISFVKRDILDVRRILRPLHGTLQSLTKFGPAFYGESKAIYFSDLEGDYFRIWNIVENLKDTIESIETTNQTLLSSRIDEVMRLISILAFLLAPFTVIGTLFQINTQFTPIIGHPLDWWIAFSLMTAGSVFLYLYFKRRGWL